jgi:hypothetical protein
MAKVIVCFQIIFIAILLLIEDASMEAMVNTSRRLLAKYYEASGTRKVEHFIWPIAFLLENASNPSPAMDL